MAPTTTTAAVLIGDVVGSKQHADRAGLQDRLVTALRLVNDRVPALQPLDMTIGDEFQGAYRQLCDAVRATLLLRLTLLPGVDTRYGLGTGELTVFDEERQPLSQDGPAWWAAREAITHVHAQAQRGGQARGTRTWFHAGRGRGSESPEQQAVVNALLVCRDALVPARDPRNLELVRGWVFGKTQQELAAEQEITQSAVSQRLSSLGAFALRDADRLLGEAAG